MNSSIAPIGIARRMILAIVTSEKFIPGTLNGFIERNCFVVSSGKSRDVAMKRPKVCVYLLMLYLRICSCLACVYRVMDARGKFGEHERCVRVARGDSRVQL